MPTNAEKGTIIVPNVEAFEAGHWQGETYTARDLEDILRNFREFSSGPDPLLEVPVVIGHEEDQSLLENTGIPSVGWVKALRRRGTKLFADLTQIFPQIAELVEAGSYKHVSAEIYPRDNPPEGVPAKGCMLRRIALLGGQLPHLKSLADLPPPVRQHSERWHAPRVRLTTSHRAWQDTSKTWACFSEVTAMAEDAVQQVAEAAIAQSFPGLPPEFISSLTPDQMGMLASAIAPTEEPLEDDTGDKPAGMAEFPADAPSREAVIAALVAQGQDQAALDAMSDEELIALYTQTMGGGAPVPMSEDAEEFEEEEEPVMASTVTPAPVSVPAPVRRRQPVKVTTTQQFSEQLAELHRGLTLAQQQLAAQQRQIRQRERLDRVAESNKKKAAVRAFCEQLSKAGKVSPAEVEFDQKTGEPLGALAFALSSASAVRKFSEGKEVKSDLEVLMEKLEQRPVRRFGEQVQDPVKGTPGAEMTPERREQLLRLTSRGRAVIARESERKQNARMFAEQLAGVLNGKLNGAG